MNNAPRLNWNPLHMGGVINQESTSPCGQAVYPSLSSWGARTGSTTPATPGRPAVQVRPRTASLHVVDGPHVGRTEVQGGCRLLDPVREREDPVSRWWRFL